MRVKKKKQKKKKRRKNQKKKQKQKLKEKVKKQLKQLKEKKLREISSLLGISIEGARQMEERCLGKIKYQLSESHII